MFVVILLSLTDSLEVRETWGKMPNFKPLRIRGWDANAQALRTTPMKARKGVNAQAPRTKPTSVNIFACDSLGDLLPI